MSELKQIHALVLGRVQGVYFRAHAQKEAVRLGLKGWIRNLASGEVETVAEGLEIDLKKFIEYLNKGSPEANVIQVKIEWLPVKKKFYSFEIVR
ncbi:MAG: acylphosphatase [Candidatus Diapherotrites archaeon]|nr:acylphosphatase [Candidatus Diapherotrites archaeon]